MIIWIVLGIVAVFMAAALVLIGLALAAGKPEPCPHGDTPAGCEPCHAAEIEATL